MVGAFFAGTYGYMFGIVLAIWNEPGMGWVRPGYWGGGGIFIATFGILKWLGPRAPRIKPAASAILFLSASVLGVARYADRSFIEPYDPAQPDKPYHLRALIDAFPDTDPFRSKTRITGTIDAEPEYYPPREEGRPGRVVLVIQPETFEPEPVVGESRRTFRVSDGSLRVVLNPTPWKEGQETWKSYYDQLIQQEAYGYRVRMVLAIQPPQPAANPGLYDEELFLTDQDIYGSGMIVNWDDRFPPIEEADSTARGMVLTEWALAIKKNLMTEMKRTVPFPASSYLSGVTLGTQAGLSGVRCEFEGDGPDPATDLPDHRQALLDEFRWSGTSHVLSVSGLHTTIVAAALFGIFAAMKIPSRLFTPMIIFSLIIFSLITGARPSVLRSAIMNSVVLCIYVYGKKSFQTSVLHSVSLAAILVLGQNPKWIFQPAFTLSFIAIYSLGLLTEPCDRVLAQVPYYTKIPGWLRSFLGAQCAIQVGMMWPLSAYYFTRMSIAGPFENFLAIPLSSLNIPIGLLSAGIGLLPVPGAEWLALVLNAGNYFVIQAFLWTVHWSTVIFPFPYIKTLTTKMLFVYYLGVFGLFATHEHWLPRMRIDLYDIRNGIVRGSERAFLAARWSALALLYGALCVWALWPESRQGPLSVRILAVNYGSAIHVRTPMGRDLLIDAGSAEPGAGGWDIGERVLAPYLLKQRIDHLEALILASPSPERVGGAASVLRIFPTRRFLAPFDPSESTDSNLLPGVSGMLDERSRDVFLTRSHLGRLRAMLLDEGGTWARFSRRVEHFVTTPVDGLRIPARPERWVIQAGDVLVEEAGPGGTFRIVALTPDPVDDSHTHGIDRRTAALRIEYGKTAILLPADLSRKGIESLLHLDPALLAADAVVIPSQGSQNSHSPLLLAALDIAHARTTGEDTPAPGTRMAALTYGYARDFKPPVGEGGRTQRSQDRPSPFPHRARYARSLEREAQATGEAWREAGWNVLSTTELGAIQFTSDGTKIGMTHQIEKTAEDEPEQAE